MKGHKTLSRFSWRMITSSKKRTAVLLSAVILASMMLSSILSLGLSYVDTVSLHEHRLIGHVANMTFENPTAEQIAVLSGFDFVTQYAARADIGQVIMDYGFFTVTLSGASGNLINSFLGPVFSNFRGHVPVERNELMAPVEFLEHIGIENPQIGMAVPITFTANDQVMEENFILTGIYNDFSWTFRQSHRFIYVSYEFANLFEPERSTFFMHFDDALAAVVANNVLIITLQAGLTDTQAASIITQVSMDPEVFMAVVVMLIVLLLFLGATAVVLIGNTMYILVSKDVRMYGLFKSIGSSKKHIVGIFRRYTVILGLMGAIPGTLLGSLISFVFVPMIIGNVFHSPVVTFTPLVLVLSLLMTVAVTYVSAFIPAVKTWRLSIIESTRFINISSKSKSRSASASKPILLALRNVFRDKRKAVYSLISLSLGIAICVFIATIVTSFDMQRSLDLSAEHDFVISVRRFYGLPLGESHPPMSSAFFEELAVLPGVEEVYTFSSSNMIFFSDDAFENHVEAFIQDTIDRVGYEMAEFVLGHIVRHSNFIAVDSAYFDSYVFSETEYQWTYADFEAFDRGEFVFIISDFDAELYRNMSAVEGYFDFEFDSDGNRELILPFSIPIGGVLPSVERMGSLSGDFIIPLIMISPQLLESLLAEYGLPPLEHDRIFVSSNPDYDMQIMAFLENQQLNPDNPPFTIFSLLDVRQTFATTQTITTILGASVALMIGLSTLVNFVNNIVSGIIERKRELALFESIGMGKRKLKTIVFAEGVYYSIFPVIIGIIGGSLAINRFVSSMLTDEQGDLYHLFTLNSPFAFIIGMIILVLIFSLSASSFAFRSVRNTTIVDRLKESDWV